MADEDKPSVFRAEDIPPAPSGPEDVSSKDGLDIRKPMEKTPRFSKKSRNLGIVIGGVLLIIFLFSLGFFKNNTTNSNSAAPPIVVASPNGIVNSANDKSMTNSTLDDITANAPKGVASGPPINHSNGNGTIAANTGNGGINGQQVPSGSINDAINAGGGNSGGNGTATAPPPQSAPTFAPSVPDAGSVPNGGTTGQSSSLSQPQSQLQQASLYVGNDNRGQSGPITPVADTSQGGQTTQSSAPCCSGTSTNGVGGQSGQTSVGSSQGQRIAFGGGDGEQPFYLPALQQDPVGKYELWAGSVIPLQLDTAIDSDLPGAVVAHVTHAVYDSKYGRYLLIPKDSRLIGRYNSTVGTGQVRLQVLWDQLIWPDGEKIDLQGQVGTDTEGNSGMVADVNAHTGRIIGTTLITGILGGLQNVGQSPNNCITSVSGQIVCKENMVQNVLNSVGQNAVATGQSIVQQQMQQPPTLTVPRSTITSVLLNKTILLTPWRWKP